MWKLTIEDDEGQQTSIPLAQDEYGIGRDKANTIRLTDRNVSRRHAKLRSSPEGWYATDLDSYNGTYVNGVRIQGDQLIANGDIVQLGDYRLEFVDETLTTPASESSLPAAHQRPNRLVVVVGPNPGAEYPLVADAMTMGRAEEAMISINHSSVSRMHCELIALGGGRYEIIDKGSANGIRINGVELRRGILEAGDALELGDVRLRFVGQGKIFRAAEMSQQLAAVGTYEAVARPVKKGSSLAPIIALFVALCIAGAVVFVVANRNKNQPTTPRVGSVGAEATSTPSNDGELLATAKELLTLGHLEDAHRTLQDISEASPLRDDATFKDIETKWADALFAKVDEEKDPAAKRTILQTINATPTFEPAKRKKAAEMIRSVDAEIAAAAASASAAALAANAGNAPTATAKVADAAPGAPINPDALDPAKIRASVENKVWAGRGSLDEIRLLAAVCGQLKDYGCRDKARAMLKAKKEQQNP